MAKKVLIIDDDADLCVLLQHFLQKNGFEAFTAYSGREGLKAFAADIFDVVICDYRLGDMDGISLIRSLKEKNNQVPILVITGYSDIRIAVQAIKLGAFDYILKPLIPDEVLNVLHRITTVEEKKEVSHPNSLPQKQAADYTLMPGFYKGVSPSAVTLYEQASVVADTNYSVILYGESGTGKEVVARVIHNQSSRRHKPFVALDCGTLSKELAGSELFGHMKGAFTGALADKEGHFELAEGGTLFLDEIGNLSPDVQAALLRVIQERKFKRIGGNKEMPVDVRIIVASNENLKDAYLRGRFREDLYHRLNEFPIHLPRLKERPEDILPLADFFLDQSCKEIDKNIANFHEEVLNVFRSYPWPGNLREFRNVVRRAVLLTRPGEPIQLSSLPEEIRYYYSRHDGQVHQEHFSSILVEEPEVLKEAASKAEYELIMTVLKKVNFNKKKAAEYLHIDRKTLYNKLKNFQMHYQG
jgi:two-component system response regulator HydG